MGKELGEMIMVLELPDELCGTLRWSCESEILSLDDKLGEEDKGEFFRVKTPQSKECMRPRSMGRW